MKNDMKTCSTTSALDMFLDDSLVIRHFARDALRIYHCRLDVGRPLSDIKSHLEGDDLSRPPRRCSRPWSLRARVRTSGGVWYMARISPTHRGQT